MVALLYLEGEINWARCGFVLREARGNLADVFLRFAEWRNAAVALDHFRAGVVRGERERQVAAETFEKFLQVARAGFDILRGLENVGDGEARSSTRQQLHQA